MKPFMKTLMSATAVAALVAITPLPAQEPAPEDPALIEEPATAPEQNSGKTDMETVQTEEPKYLGEQDSKQLLASSLIGASVFNTADETLGDINDLVMSQDGRVEAVVIGVGGFLGFGQKNVAVNFEAISQTADGQGNLRLVFDATAEELEAAPPFITVAEMRQQEELERLANPPVPEPAPARPMN